MAFCTCCSENFQFLCTLITSDARKIEPPSYNQSVKNFFLCEHLEMVASNILQDILESREILSESFSNILAYQKLSAFLIGESWREELHYGWLNQSSKLYRNKGLCEIYYSGKFIGLYICQRKARYM